MNRVLNFRDADEQVITEALRARNLTPFILTRPNNGRWVSKEWAWVSIFSEAFEISSHQQFLDTARNLALTTNGIVVASELNSTLFILQIFNHGSVVDQYSFEVGANGDSKVEGANPENLRKVFAEDLSARASKVLRNLDCGPSVEAKTSELKKWLHRAAAERGEPISSRIPPTTENVAATFATVVGLNGIEPTLTFATLKECLHHDSPYDLYEVKLVA